MAAAFHVISSDMVETLTGILVVFAYFQIVAGTAITIEYSAKINCKLTLGPHLVVRRPVKRISMVHIVYF